MDPAPTGAQPPGGDAGLVGRARELAVLRARLAEVEAGRGALIAIVGEPGIGKTRLARAAAEEARGLGLLVVRGAGWDGGGAPSCWPWIEVARGLRAELPAPDERLRRDLGPLWDDGAAASAPTTEAGDPELLRFRRLDALRALLAAATARRGLVVVLEDLHAADPGTVEALLFVARAVHDLRALLIATWRTDAAVGPALAPWLARVAAAGEVLRPAPLAPGQVGEILGALEPVPAGMAEELHRRSGGNPLFVQELVQHVRAGGSLDEVPERVGAAIAERLSRLGTAEREALEAAAILGQEARPEELVRMVAATPAELGARLGRCQQAGVLLGAGTALAFAHPLYREHVLAGIEPARRARLHLAAADVAERSGGPGAEERVARHLVAAAPQGDRGQALAAVLRARDAAFAALDLERAAELLEAALRLGAGDGAGALRSAELRLELAELLARTGRGERSRELAREVAREARRDGDAALLARAALVHGAELRIGVVDPELVGALEEALRGAPPDAAGLRARLLARLAAARQPAPDPEVPLRLAREAVAQARASGDADVLVSALHAAGSAMAAYAPPGERLALSSELYQAARVRGDLVVAQQAAARLAVDAAELDDLSQSAAAAAAHEQLGAALGHPRWRWRGPLLRSMCALAAGRWEEAAAALALAEERAGEAGDPAAELVLFIHRVGSYRARASGDPGRTTELLRAVPAILTAQPAMNGLMHASTLARLGRLDAARAILAAVDASSARAVPVGAVTEADVAMRLGDRGRAAALLPMLARLDWPAVSWGAIGYVWDGPLSHWVGGLLAVLERWDEAIPALEQALAVAVALAARPVAADVRCTLALALAGRGAAGDGGRAADLAAEAAREAEALGMVHLLARARGAVPRPGRPTAPALAARATLSREGDIWTLRFDGRAARLRHSRGLELLDALLGSPGREFHVLELSGAGPGREVDAGDAGELLDDRARRAYRGRAEELDAELREAEAWNDPVRRERLEAELELLRTELAHGLALGGRPRRAAGAAERARVNVQKRLRGAIGKVAEVLPEAGRHLERAVRTGLLVTYRP